MRRATYLSVLVTALAATALAVGASAERAGADPGNGRPFVLVLDGHPVGWFEAATIGKTGVKLVHGTGTPELLAWAASAKPADALLRFDALGYGIQTAGLDNVSVLNFVVNTAVGPVELDVLELTPGEVRGDP